MLLSQTSRYALQAASYLAARWDEDRPIPVGEIAEALGVPRNYLSKILHQLARTDVLTSARGPAGGFRLSRDPGAVMLAEVVLPVEPGLAERRCLLGRETCSDDDACPAHAAWREVADQATRFLEQTSLADLSRGD